MNNKDWKIAIKALKTNKIRTILSVFSIIIGIVVMILVTSAGQSLEKLIYTQMESYGTNIVQIEIKIPGTKHASTANAAGMAKGIVITTLKDTDRNAIVKLDNISQAYSGVLGQDLLSWQGNINKSNIFGITSDFIKIDTAEVKEGRFFTQEEEDSLSKVVILGSSVKEDLFSSSIAIGENVKINRMNFKVIGVMEERGGSFGFDMDNLVYMPLQTTQKLILGIDYVSWISAEMIDTEKEEQTVDSINHILRDRHDISNPNRDDFGVMSMSDAQEMMDNIIGGITLLLAALAIISLLVGGVGIMNIMYVSVAERTFEIGLRKSVGASKKDILKQFLTEGVIITFLGGVLGVFFGIVLTYLIYFVAVYYDFDWPFTVSTVGIVTALIISILIGLIFSLRPAKKAAELNPMQALRKE